MFFENLCTDLVQGCFHGLNLADDVNTIGILLHHTDDPTQMSFNGLQPSNCAIVFHGYLLTIDRTSLPDLTPPRGVGHVSDDTLSYPDLPMQHVTNSQEFCHIYSSL